MEKVTTPKKYLTPVVILKIPKTTIRTPKIMVYFFAVFLEIFLFSSVMAPAVIEALIIKATKSEAINVTEMVIGKYFMNSPIIPGHNSIGRKAKTVVKVEVMTGKAISPIPYLEANRLGKPFSILA